jgi:hypothetical protein
VQVCAILLVILVKLAGRGTAFGVRLMMIE